MWKIKPLLALSVFLFLSEVFPENAGAQINTSNLSDTLSSFSVRDAPEWTEMFYRTGEWFGADGVFSFSLDGRESIGAGNGGKNLLIFSDTMTGDVRENTVYNFKMVNNSVAYITGIQPSDETVEILLNHDTDGNPVNYFSPETENSRPDEYYWLGDGFINKEDGNSLNIFAYRVIDNSNQSWDFEVTGTTLITIPGDDIHPPFENQQQTDTPLYIDIPGLGKGTFGSGIYVNTDWAGAPNPDGFLYIYGLVDPGKQLVVARVKPSELKKFNAWRFWDGTNWNRSINSVKPVTERVSNEVSLTPLKAGRYLLVFQLDGIGDYTAIRIGDSPVGPFGPVQKIRKVPELTDPPGIIPYNAKAHPVLSTEEELLISYNTITMDYFNDILNYPHSYRPRFFWLKIGE
ncbi:hypothetical protein [Rhodohalobacter sp. 614A]|uniref:hypothetical protein n=1 Tax=Rhodohalobacter sp. 614A TaxID=2908649 RepID=UPI001F233BF3|nr:hypothetical protein [Rhodohalobacter sp. 614A]